MSRSQSLQCAYIWYLYDICVLNMVTRDFMEIWTENLSKYKIEQISVYLTW